MSITLASVLRQPPRNDASTLFGLQSPKAFVVVGWFTGAGLLAAGYGSGGVGNWPLFALAYLVLLAAVAALTLAPGDPIGPLATAVVATAPSVVIGLGVLSCARPPAVAFGVLTGCVSALAAFLCVRGRVVAAWSAFVASVAVSVAAGVPTGMPMIWASTEIASVAVLLMAMLFAAIIRPAAREIYALRAQTVREAGHAAAVAATAAERVRQLARLDEQARELLEMIASGRLLSEGERFRCRLVEARLRDGIRAPALDVGEVVEAVWSARERGVGVTLLDDGGSAAPGAHGLVDSSRDSGIAGLRAALVDLVRSLAPGDTVTVRIHPLGRDPIGTIVVRTDDGARRLDYRASGEPEIRDRTEITD
ncbi:hypothetical protein QNM97_04980 [Gordonia sp. L191]|uniref:hypothetical protein n=1 Tax=Gordonia sp. L191 TaxID=2982699 RepID=UPI0024BF234C|nr:hypothetical protein [Gordonia sp. L191]WHU48362.1 hypothetical protein QNM97_04980 [Gordonia sp. L191]